MIISIVLFVFCFSLIFFWYYSNKKYSYYEEELKGYENEYILSSLFSIGYLILDLFNQTEEKIVSKANKSKRGRQKLITLERIYGKRNVSLHYKFLKCNVIVIIFIGIFLMSFLVAGVSYKEYQRDKSFTTVLEKPEFFEDEETKNFKVKIQFGDESIEKNIDLTLTNSAPDETLVKEKIKQTKEMLINFYNPEGKPYELFKDYSLISSVSQTKIKLNWKSDCPEVFNSKGVVKNEDLETNKIVNMAVELSYDKKVYDTINISFDIKPYEEYLEMNETSKEIYYAQKELDLIVDEFIKDPTKKELKLPENLSQNITLSWEDGLSSNIPIVILLVLGFVGIISYAVNSSLNEKVEMREEEITKDFAEFLSKLILLITAGSTVNKSIDKIVDDYERAVNERKSKRKALYEELSLTVSNINGDKKIGIEDAYKEFARRCKVYDAVKFSALLIQYSETGSDQFVSNLVINSSEAWKERKRIAERRGKAAETKLLIPILLIFFAIMAIVMTPIGSILKL